MVGERSAATTPAWLGTPRGAGCVAGALLGLIYAATAAPDVTWWDAGELIAAAHTLGIPHPPGTPLYVLLANVWARMLSAIDRAFAINLFSALCTAVAGGIAAALIARATRSAALGIAAALCAGAMSTVWLSATEAEVYGPSLCLGMLMLWSGERAGRTGDSREVVLTGYLFALAAPLHATALVAGPAAVTLAATGSDDRPRWWTAGSLGATLIAAAGIATGRWGMALAAVAALVGVIVTRRFIARGTGAGAAPGSLLIAGMAGASALAFLVVRAAHDPGINQGNPATIAAMVGVIARDQYDVAGLWPRQAPPWLQLVNLFEYVDWQVALGIAPGVTPTVPRTLVTLVYVLLGTVGSVVHHRIDRRGWRGLAVLGVCGSLGVLAYLNLKAGPSIGYGILPDDALHEPRERDYFFVLAFWTWGLWAGLGAVALARQRVAAHRTLATAAGVIIAGLPAALNWSAVNRRTEPDASLPQRFAEAMLRDAPSRAVLLVAGDNDTYPLWYLQQVRGVRPDVVVVTYPLMGAGWYRQELRRRWDLGPAGAGAEWHGMARELASLAASARDEGRPLAVAVTVDRAIREQLGRTWELAGMTYVERGPAPSRPSDGRDTSTGRDPGGPAVDSAAVARSAARLEGILRTPLRESIDPTARMMRSALTCPSLALRATTDSSAARLLESTCNSR